MGKEYEIRGNGGKFDVYLPRTNSFPLGVGFADLAAAQSFADQHAQGQAQLSQLPE